MSNKNHQLFLFKSLRMSGNFCIFEVPKGTCPSVQIETTITDIDRTMMIFMFFFTLFYGIFHAIFSVIAFVLKAVMKVLSFLLQIGR